MEWIVSTGLSVLVETLPDDAATSPWEVLTAPFMRQAFIIGTLVALASGVVGYFVLLRDLPFATHAIAHIGFPGATLAALLAIPTGVGLVVACLIGAVTMGALSRRARDREVVTGTVLAFASALGILFNSLGTGQSGMITSILFGNVLAVSPEQIIIFGVITLLAITTLLAVGRPLFFASVDPEVAAARGVPTRTLGALFLIVMSLIVAGAVTVVGVLLIFALLVTPAAAAVRVTARPGRVIALAVTIALVSVWGGLTVAAFQPWPPSFVITAIACLIWLAAQLSPRIRGEHRLHPANRA